MRSIVALYLEIENCYYTCTFDRYLIDPRRVVSLVDENIMLMCVQHSGRRILESMRTSKH